MKRITAFLGCVCLFLFLLCPAVSAQAAELNSFLTFHEIVTEEHQNDLLVYGTVLPENGSLTVSIDSQQISDPVLTTVRQEKLPTTVYCLVDISTHMSKEQIEQQTDILDIISSRMGEGDSMVITTVGSKVVEGAVLDTMDARTAAIDTLKRDGVRADMYSAIVEAMGSLEKKTSYCTNRCLLILRHRYHRQLHLCLFSDKRRQHAENGGGFQRRHRSGSRRGKDLRCRRGSAGLGNHSGRLRHQNRPCLRDLQQQQRHGSRRLRAGRYPVGRFRRR